MDLKVILSEYEEDVLKEIISISFAKVADSFGQLTRQPVLLHVPEIKIVSVQSLNEILPPGEIDDIVVESAIHGDLQSKDFIIFKRDQADILCDICLGPENTFKGNYPAMKKSLLVETTNILTAALVTQFANIFSLKLFAATPQLIPYARRRLFSNIISNLALFRPFVLSVKTDFRNIDTMTRFPMIIVFDINSITKLVNIIRQRNKRDPVWLAHYR